MKNILFLIHDLGGGGAEKVLVNLVNHMDRKKWNITVMVLFGGGVNENALRKDVRLICCHEKAFRGNSHVMKLFSPRFLYRHYIREHYDVAVSFLEGPCARILSGCDDPQTRTVAWIHGTLADKKTFSVGFHGFAEAVRCYSKFEERIFVSKDTQKAFEALCPGSGQVLYNVLDTEHIAHQAQMPLADPWFQRPGIYLCAMGKLTANKGFDRLLRIHRRLREDGFCLFTCILGEGQERAALQTYIDQEELQDSVRLPGYRENPYPYLQKCHLFVCASHSEGYSTAAAEALILGVPVCAVEVSGMTELLGANTEYGVVTDNSEEALYQSIRRLLEDPALLARYREQAALRGKDFSTEKAVGAVEQLLEEVAP